MPIATETCVANVEIHETPFGTRHVAAAFGDEVWVSVVPLDSLPYTLTDRPYLRPHSQTVMFTVLRSEDGSRDVVLRHNPRRRPPAIDAAFNHARGLATAYANDHAGYMDELRVTQRDERLAELARLVANTPTRNEKWLTDELKRKAEGKLTMLPEAWQDLIRGTAPTHQGLLAAPEPLGPLLRRNSPENETEKLVFQVCGHLVGIQRIEHQEEQIRAKYLAEAESLRDEADREAVPSGPSLP